MLADIQTVLSPRGGGFEPRPVRQSLLKRPATPESTVWA
jgi:hypothetical protein